MNKVAVIGCGIAGLSAACCLAKDGYQITVFEKNGSAGGRARRFEEQGFLFDAGPSWYWMPDVFERFFARFGKTTSDFYSLVRLDPSYRVFYSKSDRIDLPAGMESITKLFESIEPGSGSRLVKFIDEARKKYDVGINNMVYKPYLSISELCDRRLLSGLISLDIFQPISNHIRKYFRDPRLIQLLEFPVLFLGASPQDTPALYSLMNYADMASGTWYPMGGMYRPVQALESLARSLGVKFEFNSPVRQIAVKGTRANGVMLGKEERKFDQVVAGADYYHVEQELIPATHRKYTARYWERRMLAPSSLLFYVGVNKKLSNLLHHNLFFDQDFSTHIKEIYDRAQWPTNPLFYVCCPSKTDSSVAPPGHENLFILIPVASGLEDSEYIRDKYFDLIIGRLESLTDQKIRPHIVLQKSYGPSDFRSDYNSFKGNAYGLANTLLQTAWLKPSVASNKVQNLFYTGQMTTPGPGVPSAIISGQVTADVLRSRVGKS